MRPFELVRLPTLPEAQKQLTEDPVHRAFRAGGIDLIDRMKEGIEAPERLVELRPIGDAHGERMRNATSTDAGFELGALLTLADLSSAGELEGPYEALRDAAGEAATPGIRNTATLGGNLLQRPRCWYYRHSELLCLKKGGDVCLAIGGDNRYNAILGGGPSYIVHPSSLASPLVALGASVVILQPDGKERSQPLEQLFALPTVDATREHTLTDGEVVLAVVLPKPGKDQRSAYVAAREKQSHDWPLAEAAVSLRMEGDTARDVRVVLGHVAPVPWRSAEAEKALEGQKVSTDLFEQVANAALSPARPLGGNRYKIPLTRGVLRQALHAAANLPLPE